MGSIQFYKQKRILVTGAGGFIGSHLVEALLNSEASVTALVHYNSRNDIGWLTQIREKNLSNFRVVNGDITDSEYVSSLICEQEVVFNLAALIAIPFSYISPRLYSNVNFLGVQNLLEATRRFNNRLIQVSTSEVYGTPVTLPITELHPIQPQSPYAASKASADLLCRAYRQTYGIDVNILRPFNTYGPRQSLRAIIPTILAQLISGSKEVKIGSINPKRDFTYVSDTVSALLIAGSQRIVGYDVIHLGTGETISIEDLFKLCNELLGTKAKIIFDFDRKRPEASEVLCLQSDPSLAKKILEWQSLVNLKAGLMNTIEWITSKKDYLQEARTYHV